jgi:hypothetical protein
MSKYHAVKTVVDGITFASKAEAQAYRNRKLLQASGEISNLKLQPRFRIEINGVHVCDYIADFEYDIAATGVHIVEDVKGVRTAAFILKQKLMKAVHGIDVLCSSKDEIPF